MSAGSQLKPSYRNRLAVWADKYLFLLLFAFGSGAIVTMKQLGFGQLEVTAVPICTMFLYGAYVLRTPRYRVRSDRAGDSLYYLGFLFTMVSLAYSLYEFKGEETRTQLIVTNFGIALATTIMGLMLRVVYHQLRDDPFDVEQEARIELSQAVNLLHGVLMKAVSDFDALRTSVSQVVGEAAEDTKTRLKIISDEIAETAKAQQDFLTTFSKQAAEELVAHHKAMLEASKSMTAGVKRCADRLEKVDIPPDIIKTRLDALNIPADLIKDRLDRVEIPPNIIKERIEHVEIPPNIIKERLEAVEIPRDIFTAAFARMARAIEDVFSALAATANSGFDAIQKLQELISNACAAAEKLKEVVAGAGDDAEKQRAQLKSALAGLSETLSNLETTAKAATELSKANVQQQEKLLADLANSATVALRAVEESNQELKRELSSSATAVGQVHGSLVSLTKTVVDKLNGRA